MLRSASSGWIGIDVGSRSLKMAQLVRSKQGVRLLASAITPRWVDDPISPIERHRKEILSARALGGRWRGKHTAATLSMDTCTLDAGEQPEPSDDSAPVCRDSWLGGRGEPYHLSLPQAEVVALCDGVVKTGLRCEVVDGQPLALARSLRMIPGYDPGELLGALDWGASTATFVASRGSEAMYVRKLKESGLRSLLETIASDLGISQREVERELQTRGVNEASGDQLSNLFRTAVKQAVSPVVQEMKRTLSHLGGKLKSKGPDRLLVMGAGGAVAGLPELLGESIGMQGEAWSAEGIAAEQGDVPPCLFASAISLSALAWEAVL